MSGTDPADAASSAGSTGSPLHGIRVVELGTLIAGPYASSLLAQFGADVVKVESPGLGDPLRGWRKLHDDAHGTPTSYWWYAQSRNKQSVTIDLRRPEGQDLVRRLVRDADIVIENFRPGTLEGWGLGWTDLAALNPRLVMVRVSGYGQTGPERDRPGFAAIAEAMGGLRHVTGYPDRPPVRVGVSLGDSLASLYGVFGALLAMHHVKVNGGVGQLVDVALYEAVFGVMESLIPEYAALGHVRERSGASLPGITPSNTYPCRDGTYVIVAGNSDGIFRRLMVAIGRTDLADDPALQHNAGRTRQDRRIDDAIGAWTVLHDLDHVLATLDAVDVPVGRIYTAADIHRDPHYAARAMIETHALPDGAPIDLPGIVPTLSATPGRTRWVGPRLGEHTDHVLEGLGLDAAEIAALRAAGVI